MDDGAAGQMGDAVLSVRRVRDVFRDAGWPERLVATLPDVTLGEYMRQIEQPLSPPAPPSCRLPPPQWPAWPVSEAERRELACDPAANAIAALRYMKERYGNVRRAWEAYSTAAYREYLAPWPVSPAPSSPHGDPMASAFGRR